MTCVVKLYSACLVSNGVFNVTEDIEAGMMFLLRRPRKLSSPNIPVVAVPSHESGMGSPLG